MVKLLNKLSGWYAPRPTRLRIVIAVAIALLADFLQVILLPVEWAFAQQIVDVITMGLMILIIGFHPLLLPTFIVEFIPLVDMMPTWTACVIAVIAFRRRAQHEIPPVHTEMPPEKPLPEKMARRADADL